MPSLGQKKYLEQACQTYAEQLEKIRPDNDQNGVIGYLREHAVTFATATKYRLGYVGEPLAGDDRFRNMLAIPYLTPSGVVALKFRSFNESGSKYAQHHGQKTRLFNSPVYFSAGDTLGISEGEIDAIAATEYVIHTVGVPGATNWSKLWNPLFKDFSLVLIFADGDDAGKSFAARATEEIGWRARVVQCPEGEDVASMCATGRASELTQLATEDL
jgi:DNA primase